MLDYNKRIDATEERVTVKDLIKYLKTLNKDAKISVLGDPQFYIHVEQDGSEVIFDDSALEDEYPMGHSMSNYLERNKAEEKSKRKEREERKKTLNRAYGEYVKKELDAMSKEANDLYAESIKAQTEIPVDEDKQELQSAGPYMEAFLQDLHYTKKGPNDLKEMLTGKVNPETFKEAYVGIGDCRNTFEAMMHSHLNRIVTIATPVHLVIALVTTHKGKLVVIPQCPNNTPVYLQVQQVLNINGINFQVNDLIKSLSPERLVVTDIFKLSRLAEMAIPNAIEYCMKQKEYDARDDEEAKKMKDAYRIISENYNSRFGALVPLAIPVKH